jgi:small subunit ribosomal protein S7
MRKRKPKKRFLAPDPRYKDPMVTQFINNLMWSGKKNTTMTTFYNAMDIISERTGENPHDIWKKALENVMPGVEVRSRRIGGATFQIPTEIRPARKISMGMKWIIKFARDRSGKGISEKLAAELIAASKGEGNAVKRREDTHRMAESNRAFAHFKV